MTESTIEQPIPRGALIAVGLLLATLLAGVAAVRISGIDMREPDAGTVVSRTLRFEDRADGGISVIDATSGREVATVNGEQGFMRGALRALARERKLRGLGSEQPFELLGREDGRLTLRDTATGQRIDLESFGPTNAAVFVRLMTAQAPGTASDTTHTTR
jgi:putative photosynthetic complex assembly protein